MKKQGRFSTKMIILIPVFVIGIISIISSILAVKIFVRLMRMQHRLQMVIWSVSQIWDQFRQKQKRFIGLDCHIL